MTIFYGIALALSLAILLGGYLMDRSAIHDRINGANGLPMLAALVVSIAGSLLVALIAAVVQGWAMLVVVIAASAIYHLALGWFLIGRLQSFATRTAAHGKA